VSEGAETKEPRALLRCAALAELTHHLDLDLAKRSGGCSSETTRARALGLQRGAEQGLPGPAIASARPAASESRRSAFPTAPRIN
jgi:hypothetical protein